MAAPANTRINLLKLTGLSVALLINFNVPVLKQGVRRLVHPQFYGKDSDLFTPQKKSCSLPPLLL